MVTGGGGFLGRVVCELLANRGAILNVPRRADTDLTHQNDVTRLFDAAKPEIVIHLAAEVGGIGANQSNPGRYFFANMAMGLHAIEAARLHGVEKFVQAGTVCAYPKHTPVPFKEEALWDGYPEETNAPYGIAKKALLVMLQSYRAQYDFNGIYLLPVNLYGPNDNFDLDNSHVIPALIRKFVTARAEEREYVEVWGSGSASREFLYVDDAAKAIVMATESYSGSDPVNIGSGKEITIRDLVALIAELTAFDGDISWDTSRPDGQPRRALDTTRARDLLGFEAQVELKDGLRSTIEWWESQRSAIA